MSKFHLSITHSTCLCLILVCFATSFVIQKFDIWHVKNYSQELFRFGWISLVLICTIGSILILKLKLYSKYPIFLALIYAGIISNIIEKIAQGYVTDYFYLIVGVANFADLYIYFGVFAIVSQELLFRPQN